MSNEIYRQRAERLLAALVGAYVPTGTFDYEEFRRRLKPEHEGNIRIHEQLTHALADAPITNACRSYIINRALRAYSGGLPPLALTPIDTLGIDMEKGEYGIFDPALAKESERTAFRYIESTSCNIPIIAEVPIDKILDLVLDSPMHKRLEAWRVEFKEKYGEEP